MLAIRTRIIGIVLLLKCVFSTDSVAGSFFLFNYAVHPPPPPPPPAPAPRTPLRMVWVRLRARCVVGAVDHVLAVQCSVFVLSCMIPVLAAVVPDI